MSNGTQETDAESAERWETLAQLEGWLATPMIILSFIWLLLLIVEFVWGSIRIFEVFGVIIWILFLIEFVVRFILAPDKGAFAKSNWIGIVALMVPAVRLLGAFRLLRLARAARGLRLVRVVGAANRGMTALRSSMGRRGLGYVLAATVLVALLGAAGMLAFEPAGEVAGGFTSYADALWWTTMLITTIGSAFWPQSVEGRVLCFILSLYGMTVFGYITASLASFFIGREASAKESDIAGAQDIAELRREITLWRLELERSRSKPGA